MRKEEHSVSRRLPSEAGEFVVVRNGRSPGFRVILLVPPSRFRSGVSTHDLSPVTVAGGAPASHPPPLPRSRTGWGRKSRGVFLRRGGGGGGGGGGGRG